MKALFRNFKYMFRRFFTANMLNLFGMALSLAAFVVIMKQVDYDYTYDKGIKDYDKIFLMEIYDSLETEVYTSCTRPLGEIIAESSPHIKAAAILANFPDNLDVKVGENIFSTPCHFGFGDYMKILQPEMICGSTDVLNLERPDRLIIPESMARKLFGSTDVIDSVVHISYRYYEYDMYVGGVYKDFPENSTFKNIAYGAFYPMVDKDNWQNVNYRTYLRLDNGNSTTIAAVAKAATAAYAAHNTGGGANPKVRLIPLTDLHFKFGESSKLMVYLLMCASFLLVIIAAVNYTNFTLAETPMRLRSINTQKVLGATTSKLRTMLIGESVLVCLLGFVIAVGILFLLPKLGVQELVSTDINPLHQPEIIGWAFILCVVIGLVAGLYPAWYATSFPPALVLKGSYGLSPQGKMLRTVLICIQFVVVFTLTTCIGVMYMQSRFIRTSDYGYDKELVLAGNTSIEVKRQKEAVRNELMQIKGVEGVSFSQFILSTGDKYMGWGRGDEEHHLQFQCLPVDYHYLTVMGIKVTEGRNFNEYDGDVYIFNEAARKQYPWLELDKPILPKDHPVIGFCENLKFASFRENSNNEPMAFMVFGEAYKNWANDAAINIRIAKNIDKLAVAKKIQKTLEEFSPGHDFNIRFIDQILNMTYQTETRFLKQIMLFSILAIAICLIGVFGLTMFESEYRKKEIGLRKIMGCSTTTVLWMFNLRYIKILLGCFAVGAPLGWKFSHEWLQTFTERTPIHWWLFPATFVLVAAFTLFIVTVRTWNNARRNPVESIKTE